MRFSAKERRRGTESVIGVKEVKRTMGMLSTFSC